MKKLFKNLFFAIISVSSITTVANAQSATATIDPRISEVYGNSIQQLIANDPHKLPLLTQLLNQRIEIIEMDMTVASSKFSPLSQQPLFTKFNANLVPDVLSTGIINPLKYDLNFFNFGDSGYWIDGTNKVLFIKGMKNFNNQ